MITCEICDTESSDYSVYFDTRTGTTHYVCDDFHCNCAFDYNGIDLIDMIESR